MSASFSERMDELKALVGKGMLHTTVTFDQVYARYQTGWGDPGTDTGVITPKEISHGPAGKPGPIFNHPTGGQAGYLSMTLTEQGANVADAWSRAIGEEKPLSTTSIIAGEHLAALASGRAPLELGFLRGSAGVVVNDDGHEAYNRPPVVPRLSQEALDALRRKDALDGDTTF